jgi:hypothetical protein
VPQAALALVCRDPDFGCLLWLGAVDREGYAPYREYYKANVGPIADGMELDHACRRRRCVGHLEQVTRNENERRKRWGYRLKIARCPRGHELTAYTAMVTPEGGRVCRTCRDAQK